MLAVVVAFASFYTRQYYVWVTLFVAYNVWSAASDWRSRSTVGVVSILLALPALAVVSIWHGLVPRLGTPVHTEPAFLSTAPNALALLATYSLPLLWIALQDTRISMSREWSATSMRRAAWLLAGLGLYIGGALALGLEIPRAGGMLRMLSVLGWPGLVIFLALSYGGLLLLLRWVITDGVRQVWWAAFLLPLLTGSVLLQRYFEPAILVILFLVARPRDAVRVLDSRWVWFYPILTGAYGLSRAIYFM
jgi:hypothetical protein